VAGLGGADPARVVGRDRERWIGRPPVRRSVAGVGDAVGLRQAQVLGAGGRGNEDSSHDEEGPEELHGFATTMKRLSLLPELQVAVSKPVLGIASAKERSRKQFGTAAVSEPMGVSELKAIAIQ
jgi:hypothetical protein